MFIKRFAWLGTVAAACLTMPMAARAQSLEEPAADPAVTAQTSDKASSDSIAIELPAVADSGEREARQPAAASTATIEGVQFDLTAPQDAPDLLARKVTTQYKNINTFDGDISPYFKNINTFWGGISPVYKNINTFWGSINPYYKNINTFGDVLPDYKNINTFWSSNATLWDSTQALWAKVDAGTATSSERKQLINNLNLLISNAQAYWGPSIVSRLGGTFQSSFAAPLFGKYGITRIDGTGLSTLNSAQRNKFFFEWFDGLNGFTGYDQVDYWMQQSHWSPMLSAIQGGGKGVTVGLVDTRLMNDADLLSKVTSSGGSTAYSNVHGTAVASLIAASHDGRNIMGIAPDAKIAAYNPFDANAEASWWNVAAGINAVTEAGASVVNLSLGEPGNAFDPAWNYVFLAAERKESTIFVIAAGNDGLTQTTNVPWTLSQDVVFLLVGSVDPTNTISTFSNRPGDACLLYMGSCDTATPYGKGGYLKNYFLVAPGENILASNGNGGVARYSGTSLAAPLVTATVALLHSRWPWLKDYPVNTAEIILESAKDLGAPGVDPVYGWGMLDIEAAQAPLNFGKLTYYTVKNGISTPQTVSAVKSAANRASWASTGMYVSAFEYKGKTYRDFTIPLTSSLSGSMVNGVYYQDYVYNKLLSWAGTTKLAETGGRLALSDSGVHGEFSDRWGFKLSLNSRMAATDPHSHNGRNIRVDNSVTFGDAQDRYSVTVGQGSNSFDARQAGFGLESDYAPLDGGVNPVLGFASGGAHLRANVQVSTKLNFSFGTSTVNSEAVTAPGIENGTNPQDYKATAHNLEVTYSPKSWLSLSASLTALAEANSLLGVQASGTDSPLGGSRTQAVTLGASVEPFNGFTLSASGTRSRSTSKDLSAAYRTGQGGFKASAWQIALARTGLATRNDHLRLSLTQPLTINSGSLEVTTLAVIDRETGATGPVTQQFDVSEKPRLVGEIDYSLPVQDGAGQFSLFGRGDFRSDARNAQGVTAGARFRISF